MWTCVTVASIPIPWAPYGSFGHVQNFSLWISHHHSASVTVSCQPYHHHFICVSPSLSVTCRYIFLNSNWRHGPQFIEVVTRSCSVSGVWWVIRWGDANGGCLSMTYIRTTVMIRLLMATHHVPSVAVQAIPCMNTPNLGRHEHPEKWFCRKK